ncbi:MAG TPA: ABC transporter permease [Candidatus Dormibacteraeota bacterium]|nr:ABC transporter permease [Candidatus Dormibacteraeota bacterium]
MIWRRIGFRLLALLPILFASSVVVFFTLNLVPGSAASAFLGNHQTPHTIAVFNHRYGLDRPLVVQYVDWVSHAIHGDFGQSLQSQDAVGPQVVSRIPITLELAGLGMLVALLIGLPLGIVAAVRRGRRTDIGLSIIAVGGMSIPNFVVATVLVLVFALQLGLVPVGGYIPFSEDPLRNLTLLALPAIALGLASSTILFRIMRSSMLEVLESDYVRTATAKGVSFRMVVLRHAFRNALIPFLTVAGLEFAGLFGGAVIIEQIFLIPGLGSYVYEAVQGRDYFVLLASVMVMATMVVVVNALVDIAAMFIDPRRVAGEAR